MKSFIPRRSKSLLIAEKECLNAWIDNFQANGCYRNDGHIHCKTIGCVKDTDKHTFNESCFLTFDENGSPTTPEPMTAPNCPPGWELSSANTRTWACNGSSSATACTNSGFNCEDCVAAGCFHSQGGNHCGPDICIPLPITTTAAPTTMTHSTMQSTTPNTTLPPFEHIGSGGCPEGFFLEHNSGSFSFDCQFGHSGCATGCNNLGDCTSSCYNAEEKCQEAMTSGFFSILSIL